LAVVATPGEKSMNVKRFCAAILSAAAMLSLAGCLSPSFYVDPALGEVKISGVFHTRQPEAFVETVVAIFPVRLARSDQQAIVLSPSI